MIKPLNITNPKQAQQIIALQRKAYQIEADLLGFDKIPPLIEKIEQLMECKEQFLGFLKEDILLGFISYKINEEVEEEPHTLEVWRLAVDPRHFGIGIASQLLEAVEQLGTSQIFITTPQKNLPALQLYQKRGYNIQDEFQIKEGLEFFILTKSLLQ